MITQHDFIDRYSRLDSPIHHLPPGLKLAGTLVVLLAAILVPARWGSGFWPLAAVLAGIAGLSRIPLWFLVKRLLVFEPFVLGVAVLVLFQPDGAWKFLFVVIRCTFCLLTVILFANTTPFTDLLAVFRRLRVPSLLVTTLALMYRYLFIVIDETVRLRHAKASRTFAVGRVQVWHLLAATAGQLYVRSSERAQRVYSAMCARGWR